MRVNIGRFSDKTNIVMQLSEAVSEFPMRQVFDNSI